MAKKEKKEETRFFKEDLLKSYKFADSADVLSVVLEDGEAYTIEEVDELVAKFTKRKVN